MYAKVFRQMYEGSLATVGPWEAMITFQQFLILADRFGDVDMPPEVISRMTTVPLEIIQKGIEALTQPDAESRTPDEDGRRLVLIDEHRSWGWSVVNYGKYAKIRSAEERREYKRNWIREKRMSTPVDTVGPSYSYSDSDSDSDKKDTTAASRPTRKVPRGTSQPRWLLDFKLAYPVRAGGQPWQRAVKAANARIAEGHDWSELLAGAQRYAAYIAATGKGGTEYVMQAATFLGPDKPFADPWVIPASKSERRQDSNVAASLQWLAQQETADENH